MKYKANKDDKILNILTALYNRRSARFEHPLPAGVQKEYNRLNRKKLDEINDLYNTSLKVINQWN